MIGYISGKIIDISPHHVLIFPISGVGYEILIGELTYAELLNKEETPLYIYHHLTENSQALFGFLSLDEKKIFTELIKISGVGGKVALLLLSLGVERLIASIQLVDAKTIESVKGIGKKMAEKILLELKDKDFITTRSSFTQSRISPAQQHLSLGILENIRTTLQNMGYNPRDIERKIGEIPEDCATVEQILPFMIRELS